jgi:AcrR family transcriptional regulator
VSQAPRSVRYGEGREALLAATTRVVAERGLRNVTYRAVAEEAGVAHALVRHHFGSRDALVAEAVRYAVDRSVAASALEPGTGSVDDFASGLFDLATQDPESQAFQYELLLEARRRPELAPLVRELYGAYREATRRELDRITSDPIPGLHLLVFAALDGLMFQRVASGPDPELEMALDALRHLLRTAAAQVPASGS